MGSRGRGLFSLYIYTENFKNLLVRNHWTDFSIILQKCSSGDPLPRLFKPFGFVRKHGRQGAGLIFPIYLYRKLKKSSCQKQLDWFPYNFVEIFLWWSSTKIIQAMWICQKTWPPGAGLISSPEHKVLMVSYCGQSMSVVRRPSSVVRRAASTIALNAYSSYTPGPIDLILGRKHRGDL